MDVQRLIEVLSYNPETGILVWRQTLSPRALAGSVAGSKTADGYITLGLDGKVLKAHRVAWALHYGEVPTSIVDHENRIKDDNKIINLRLASTMTNAYNQGLASNNKTGVKGVSFCNTKEMYRACCSVGTKRKTLGYFNTVEAAAQVLSEFRAKHHKEFAND